MFWPLIGGFIAILLIVLLLGRITDASRHQDADERRH
jgi:hypothetical protein